jgi:hypothetical protein
MVYEAGHTQPFPVALAMWYVVGQTVQAELGAGRYSPSAQAAVLTVPFSVHLPKFEPVPSV